MPWKLGGWASRPGPTPGAQLGAVPALCNPALCSQQPAWLSTTSWCHTTCTSCISTATSALSRPRQVRSAALSCIGEVPEALLCHLPHTLRVSLATLLSGAATGDAVAAVRATACKALGALVMFPRVQRDPAVSGLAHTAITATIRDPVLSVRIAACWALGNACDAMRLGSCTGSGTDTGGGTLDPAAPQLSAAGGGPSMAGDSPQRQGEAAPAPVTGTSELPTPPPPTLAEHQLQQLQAMCSAAVAAGQDVDKVRANGVRAMGSLLVVVQDSGEVALHMPEVGAWLERAFTCLQSSLTTGNMKVQWNACCATMGLFGNAQLMR